jgi:hypothetical protein
VSKDNEVLHEILKSVSSIVNDHEKRIRWLEKGALMVLGAGLVIKFLIH